MVADRPGIHRRAHADDLPNRYKDVSIARLSRAYDSWPEASANARGSRLYISALSRRISTVVYSSLAWTVPVLSASSTTRSALAST